MFKTKEQMITERAVNPKGGPGEMTKLSWPEALPPHTTLLTAITLPPGSGVGWHTHDTDTEIYYVLSGELEVDDDGTVYTAKAGDIVVTGNGAGHSVTNTSDKEAGFLAVIVE